MEMVTNPRVITGIKRAIDILENGDFEKDNTYEGRAIGILLAVLGEHDEHYDKFIHEGDLEGIEAPITKGGFIAARGILAPATEPAEVSIRRLRDSE